MTHTFRKGDVVSVMATVRHESSYGNGDFVFIDIDGHHSPVMVEPDRLTLVAPSLKVGERVEWRNGEHGEVIATHADKAWVITDHGAYVIWPAAEVRVLPAEPTDDDRLREEEQAAEAAAEESRRLENAEMDKHFAEHPHG